MANNPTSLNLAYLILTGVVLVAVIFLFTILRPMMDDANSLRQEIAADTQVLKNKQDFLQSLDTKRAQLASLADVERQMAVVLPEADRTQDIVRILNEYASQSGLVLTAITNNSANSAAQTNAARARGDAVSVPVGVRTLEFDLTLAGSYEQVRLFLSLLGRSPRIIDVKNLSFASVATQPGNVSVTTKLQLYSQQAPQNLGE